jgi:hypothetical protein
VVAVAAPSPSWAVELHEWQPDRDRPMTRPGEDPHAVDMIESHDPVTHSGGESMHSNSRKPIQMISENSDCAVMRRG